MRTFWVIALATLSVLSGCSQPGDTVNCLAYPTCRPGKVEVADCNGQGGCAPVSECGETIYCADGGEITEDQYDADCETDADCVLIYEGDPCVCHDCPTGAIADFVAADYEEDWAAAACQPINCPNSACQEPIVATCVANRCVAVNEAEQ